MSELRVAVLAESETDDAVAREVVAHVRQSRVTAVAVPSIRTRGWDAMLRQLPIVVKAVYYQSEADAFVVLADTDATVPHDPATHAAPPPAGCRWCLLQSSLAQTLQRLARQGLRPAGTPLFTAVGTPVPAVEGWLLAGRAPHASEASWRQRGPHAAAASEEFKRQLKREAYGAGPPFRDMPSRASELIREVLTSAGALRTAFPGGYAPLEDAIRSW